jgi:hypothetical protein
MASSNKQIDLFGGTITTSIPSHWRDVSTIRQVPDNQEVYQDCTEQTGAVFIVEILQHQSDVKNEDAAHFFLGDLAESNGCSDDDWKVLYSKVFDKGMVGINATSCEEDIPTILLEKIKQSSNGRTGSCIMAVGSQNVVQGRVYSGTGADVGKSIIVEMCILRLEHVETDLLITLSTPNVSVAKSDELSTTFRGLLSNFCIVDWSLFG